MTKEELIKMIQERIKFLKKWRKEEISNYKSVQDSLDARLHELKELLKAIK